MKINLLDEFKPDKLFIYLEESYKDYILYKAMHKTHKTGSQAILARQFNKTFCDSKITQNILSSWIKKKTLRLDIINWLCSYININFDESNIKGLKDWSTIKQDK